MPELPKGLYEQKRDDGKVDVVGRDINGTEYIAKPAETRDHEGSGCSDKDLSDLEAGNPNKSSPREFVGNFTRVSSEHRQDYESRMLDDYMEPAEIVARALLGETKPGFDVGASHRRGEAYFRWRDDLIKKGLL